MAQIVCVGILVADILARPVESYPARGHLMLVDEVRPSIGGCAANTGIGLHKLGISAAVVGRVGRDGFGDFVRAELNRFDLDCRGVGVDPLAATSATAAFVAADGERSFIHSIGANATLTPAAIAWDVTQDARLLHIAGHFLMPGLDGEPCAQVLQEARRRGLRTSLDTAGRLQDMNWETLLPCLPHLDFLLPSFSEAARCVPPSVADSPASIAQWFIDQGVGTVALKMGEAGSMAQCGDHKVSVAPFPVHAVDATGAGDAVVAGFLTGVLHDFDLEHCARLGNAVGACCATHMGTIDGILSLSQTLIWLDSQSEK